MFETLRNLIGVYEPIIDADGVIPSGLAGVNMEYVLAGVLFAICLYGFFRILGSVISKL